jgi:hypothetical protein
MRQTYIRLILGSAGVGVVAGLLGWYPTVRIAGGAALGSMIGGIAISFVAGCVGAIPVALAGQADPTKAPQSILAATMLRFVVALGLVLPAIFSGWFERGVLALWVGISYLAMLVVDTIFAIRILGKTQGNH